MKPILVVEDEAIVRESLRDWLADSGYPVETAADGEEGLKVIGEQDVDLVLLDMRLPGKDGLQVLREARTQRPQLKGIIITAYPSIETAVEAMKIGAVDYLPKPVDLTDLEKLIEKALGPVQVEIRPKVVIEKAVPRLENEKTVSKSELVPEVQKMLALDCRFGTASCLDLEDRFEVIYHFEQGLDTVNVRVHVGKNDSLPSISNIYPCACLIENEMKELFGIDIVGSTIDFKGTMLQGPETPKAALVKPVPLEVKPAVRLKARCSEACPAGVDVPRYVRLIGEGKFAAALAVIKQANPFLGICGRVCFAPCEEACRQGKQWEPISIRILKRFAYDNVTYKESVTARPTHKRIAIVGSGPAGLTAAYYLAKLGHSVTIFEALPEPGGMMRVGIPSYRLPRKVLDDEINVVRNLGVEIRTNTEVESLDSLFQQGYQAILVAVGAHQGMKLGVEGEELPKVIDCITFLSSVSLGKPIKLGERVIVIGGGNAAIDSARTALRLGSKEVTILYRRTRKEMPASEHEVEEALHEGIKIEFLAAPTKAFSKDGAISLEAIRMKLGAPDASGRPRPEPVSGSEFQVDCDAVVAAIGQRPQIPEQFDLVTQRGNVLEVDSETLATSKLGIFAAGDAVTGPASVIKAIADGRQAAISIDKYLGGEGKLRVEEIEIKEPTSRHTFRERLAERSRPIPPTIPSAQKISSFDEVELGLTEEMAMAEGERCWRCDLEQ
ncbi:MAG: FAD-dependent oxidoreductase [Dehalococcoidia bacterium]|nr:FAD-dependent oxidoreductase [Dehalococcoidia bacterium]